MELSGELVLGLQPVGRKSKAVVQCYSEWPLIVQCDGQSGAAHTGSLYPGFLDSRFLFSFFSCFFFLSLSYNVTHTDTLKKKITQTSFSPCILVIQMCQIWLLL